VNDSAQANEREREREREPQGVAREVALARISLARERDGAARRRAERCGNVAHLKVAVDDFVVIEQSYSGAMHHRHVALAAEFQHFCPQVATQIIPPTLIVSSPTAPHTARLLIAATRATVVVVVDAGRRRRRWRATVLRINRRADTARRDGTVAQRWTTTHHRGGRTRSYLSTSPSTGAPPPRTTRRCHILGYAPAVRAVAVSRQRIRQAH